MHPHVLALTSIRGFSTTCQCGQAKQFVINALNIDFIMSVDQVMANILHMALNINVEGSSATSAPTSGRQVNAFLAYRNRKAGRDFGSWVANKCQNIS
mgnify:CR=1 FL=1